jgi:hypothetical protein
LFSCGNPGKLPTDPVLWDVIRKGWNFSDFTLTDREISAVGVDMAQREKPIFVYDANGSIGVVMEFSESDFEAYSMPDLALLGAFRTKAQAAQALAPRSRQLRH